MRGVAGLCKHIYVSPQKAEAGRGQDMTHNWVLFIFVIAVLFIRTRAAVTLCFCRKTATAAAALAPGQARPNCIRLDVIWYERNGYFFRWGSGIFPIDFLFSFFFFSPLSARRGDGMTQSGPAGEDECAAQTDEDDE